MFTASHQPCQNALFERAFVRSISMQQRNKTLESCESDSRLDKLIICMLQNT